jgi:hypothetical protein
MKTNSFLKKLILYVLIILFGNILKLNAQYDFGNNISNEYFLKDTTFQKCYLSSTIFVLTSLVPNDNYYFYNFEFGVQLNKKHALIIGATIYQYTTPEFVTWTDAPKYNGHILAFGPVIGNQYFFWKHLFVTTMINPLLMSYHNNSDLKINNGFMLLLGLRSGYRINFKILKVLFYVEPGIEFNYKAINTNVPRDFKLIDDLYKKTVFMPAFNIGFKF